MEQLLAQYGMHTQYRRYLYAPQPINWWNSEQLTQIAVYTGIYERTQYRQIYIGFINGDSETLALEVIFLDNYLSKTTLSTEIAKKQFDTIHLIFDDISDSYYSDSYQDSKTMLQFLLSLLSETTLVETTRNNPLAYQTPQASEQLQNLLNNIERNNCINDPPRLDNYMLIETICESFEYFIDIYRELQQTTLSTPIIKILKDCFPDFLYQMLYRGLAEELCDEMPDDETLRCFFNDMVGEQKLDKTAWGVLKLLHVKSYHKLFDRFNSYSFDVLLSNYSFTNRQ